MEPLVLSALKTPHHTTLMDAMAGLSALKPKANAPKYSFIYHGTHPNAGPHTKILKSRYKGVF